MDIARMRDSLIRLNGLSGAERIYTLYYDETQNVRRLYMTPAGLNVPRPQCFVLGGVAHAGPARDLGFETIRPALRLQPTAKELKFAQIARRDFPSVLRSERLPVLLDWLNEEGLFVHYQATDPLYWSTTDILDSILHEVNNPALSAIGATLKSDLHMVLRADMDDLIDLFQRFTYPNVGRDRSSAFLDELLDRLKLRRGLLPDFNVQMLKEVLHLARRLKSLPGLEWTTENVLIEDFAHFYLNRVSILRRSTHILDTETLIMERLHATPLEDNGAPFRNFRFVDNSENEIGVQLSDVVVGLFGKFFAWIVASDRKTVADTRANLSSIQERNRAAIARLLDRSIEENEIFAHNILSGEDQHKAWMFLDADGRRD